MADEGRVSGDSFNGFERQQANNNNNNNNDSFICGVVEGFYGKPWTFSQRRDLFKQLRQLNLNSFMYAPKGDAKHRAQWRQLYNETEATDLKVLIDEAAANGVDFYYSLAPGLDIVYSEPNDSEQLRRKFDQLKSLGCKSFALLFDDIEPDLSHAKDRVAFENNHASAQVAVTNAIYEYLERPKFLFCPTEYCESRAVPNVLNSVYLNTIGAGLHGGIDIMWSGSRVISRHITEESIRELNGVIRRRVLIWENLHANDYDKSRVYLGPYSGRSTKMIPQLRGVLTNPNCEFEANYVAIHTLAQWRRCSEDSDPCNKCNLSSNQQPLLTSKAELQHKPAISTTTNNNNHHHNEHIYDPDQALVNALRDWLPRVLAPRPLPEGTDVFRERNDELASEQISKAKASVATPEADEANSVVSSEAHEMKGVEVGNGDDVVEEDMPETKDRSPATNSLGSKSDMDTSGLSPARSPAPIKPVESNSCDSCEMKDAFLDPPASPAATKADEAQAPQCMVCTITRDPPGSPADRLRPHTFDLDSLALLVDFFYLPFEHGARGHAFLSDIKWLIEHSVVFLNQEGCCCKQPASETEAKSKLTELWLERAGVLSNLCVCINGMVDSLVHGCPNKLLMSELYPYLRNLHEVLVMTIEFIQYLRQRRSCLDRFYYCDESETRRAPEAELDLEEPWARKGGLVGDLQRLISSS